METGPLVSVVIPTYNRPAYLRTALASALQQDYRNLEVLVIRDGGEEVADVVRSFDDPRIVFIDRGENRGAPFTRNEGLAQARGEYVCYLDDDDLYYSDHVSTLVDALENETDCQVAYTDLYRTYCRIQPDGSREVLSKVIEVSRDFDRFVMLYFNHVLLVSLMHRRDLFEKAGPYNEALTVLIDWDLTRKLCFFSDFHHVHRITGEYYCPLGCSDRVSVRGRRDADEYLRNVMTIRTTRPAKPWPKVEDVSIVLVAERLDQQVGRTLASIWRHTFYPYEVYLPLSQIDLRRLDTSMPNVVTVLVDSGAPMSARIDSVLAQCKGEYVAIVPVGFPIGRKFWLEDSLYGLINSTGEREAFELEGSTNELWGVVLRSDQLREARQLFPDQSIRGSLKAAGFKIRRVRPEEIPFQFDQLLGQAQERQKHGHWSEAAVMFERIGAEYGNELWMCWQAAQAYFNAGQLDRASQLVGKVNRQKPSVDTLLLEAKICRRNKDFSRAIELLESAERTLEGRELIWT